MNRAGFTLLEVMVATVIMGIAVAGLIAGLSQSVKNASRLTDYDRAVMLVHTKMNDLLLDVNLPLDGSLDGQCPRHHREHDIRIHFVNGFIPYGAESGASSPVSADGSAEHALRHVVLA